MVWFGEWSMVKVRSSWCGVNPVSGCKPWRRLDEYSTLRLYGQWWKFGHLDAEWTPSAVVNPDGGWMNTAPCDWMVNGESSASLLFLYYYANSSSTLSVINYPFTIDQFWCRCWSFDQQPKLTGYLPVANSILFQRFACWSKNQHGLKWWMGNCEWWMLNVRPSCCF